MKNSGFLLLNAYSILVLIILSIIFFSKERLHQNEDRVYGLLLIICLITISIGVSLGISISLIHNYLFLSVILNKLYLCGLVLSILLFALYNFCITYTDNYRIEKIKKKICFFAIINSLIILLLPLNITQVNDIDSAAGYAVNYTYIVFGIIFVIIAGTFFQNIKKFNKKYIPILILIIEGISITLLQIFFPEYNYLINPSIVITCLIMYFTIENPDVKMLEQLSLAKDAAEKANHAKSDFLSSMSHEIRTPLNAIVGFSESLKEDKISEEALEKVDNIIIASNNLLEIVNGILDISKIEANKLEIINKDYNVYEMFDELVTLIKTRIGDRSLEFNVKIDSSIPQVLYGDKARFKQVILNLLTNAVKYTKEGYINFTVSSVVKDNICRLIISVEDSGIGIKAESLPKLFSKFERLNVEKQMTIEGTGLGLAITKKLVDLMNGKIIVQSIYGQGSKFTVSIDQRIIAVEQKNDEVPKSISKHIDANGAKILVVDDNDLNIKVANVLLKKYHFDIDSCTSGIECISKIKNNMEYDIIFLDDMMPRMSGRETLQKLKEIPEFNMPVIALTANAITGMKEEYLNAGFDDYLSKPIEKTELERVISKYLNKKNAALSNSNLACGTKSVINKDFLDITDEVEKLDEEIVNSSEEINIKEITAELMEISNSTGKKKKKKKKKNKAVENQINEEKKVTNEENVQNEEKVVTESNQKSDNNHKEENITQKQEEKSNNVTDSSSEDKKHNVLIVDDNSISIKIALTNLKNYDAEFKAVNSGPACIEEVIMNKYDMVLLDEDMPLMDGATTLDNLKTIDGFEIPVILMSSKKETDVAELIKEHGFDGYLGKPFSKESLERTLNQFLK